MLLEDIFNAAFIANSLSSYLRDSSSSSTACLPLLAKGLGDTLRLVLGLGGVNGDSGTLPGDDAPGVLA